MKRSLLFIFHFLCSFSAIYAQCTSSITLNSISDQTVCSGESIALTASANSTGAATITEDFEAGTTDWSTSNSGTYDVSLNSGGTASSGTGPNAANGGVEYAYFEATGGFSGETNYITKTFDFSATSSPQISFAYHMHGSDMGSLSLDINTGTGWTSLWSVSGQQHIDEGSAWSQNIVDLSPYAGEASFQIRFLATRGDGWMSDIALDDIVVSDLLGAISYAWDNGVLNGVPFTPTASGEYIVIANDGLGCTDTDTVVVNVSQITFSLPYDTLSYCSASPIELDAGSGFFSYLWSTGIYTTGVEVDDASWTSCVSAFESYPNWDSSQTNQTITVNQSATYYVQVTNSSGCEAIDSVVVSMLQPSIMGDTTVNAGDTAVLLGVIDGVGFLLNSYDTVYANTSTNLQSLINNASSGTVIVLDSGTYNVNLVWPSTNHIILTSSYGPEYTILDGSNAQESVIYVGNGQVGVVIDNLHIKNGYGTIPTFHSSIRFGGGILVDEDVRGVIKNCLITKNGIAPSDQYSGGLFVSHHSEVYLINNTITENYGPVWWRSGNSMCMSAYNSVPYREFGTDGVCMNNIMYNNSGYGLYMNALSLNSIQIKNNNSFGNGGQYSQMSNWYDGMGVSSYTETGFNGNISQDPLFVNAANGNYRLSSSSPSLTAGENGVKQGYENYFSLNDLIYHPELITYSWSTGDSAQQIMVTPNQTTEYCLTVSDGIQSCSTTACRSVQLPAIIEQITDSICDGDQYNFNGNLLAAVGVYNDTLIASSGQDSVIILTLLVNSLPPVTAGPDQTICL
ncbi:hypothetical protein OAN33_06660, partial [Flavobacteriales bacterium]|nr:hypothetical protein [Flavobacteriales bacterium]